MEFKNTSTSRRRQAGFTVVEMMIAGGLSGLLLAVCLSTGLFTARSIASMAGSVDLNARSRYAVDRMSQKLRQASSVKSFSASSVAVAYKGGTLTYTYYPTSAPSLNRRKLLENDRGTTTVLLEDCDNLTFALFQRNTATNAFNQFPTLTSTNGAKVIEVNWRCSRTLVGKTAGSAEMASARIVLRSK